MTYKAVLDEKEYYFPEGIYKSNEEVLKNFSYVSEDEIIIDLKQMKDRIDYEKLDLISFQCAGFVGEIVLDNEQDLKEHNELGPRIRLLDNMAKIHLSKGEEEKARENQIKLIELELNFLNKLIEKENSNKKSSR